MYRCPFCTALRPKLRQDNELDGRVPSIAESSGPDRRIMPGIYEKSASDGCMKY